MYMCTCTFRKPVEVCTSFSVVDQGPLRASVKVRNSMYLVLEVVDIQNLCACACMCMCLYVHVLVRTCTCT